MLTNKHILSVQPSRTAEIKIIGDIHGSLEPLHLVLQTLTPDDYLFIVGDIIDRGVIHDGENNRYLPTSKDVLNLLIKHALAAPGTMPKIYSVKGNHEQCFLDLLNLFKWAASENVRKNPNFRNDFEFLLRVAIENGCGWIFKEHQEIQASRFNILNLKIPGVYDDPKAEMDRFIADLLMHPNPLDELIPQILLYRDFMATLPFVIKIDMDNPILVVHADLPFTDAEIDQRIASLQGFNAEEVEHITSARLGQFSTVRDEHSHLVVVGHNILRSKPGIIPDRRSTNHLNLDCGAFVTENLLCYDVRASEVSLIGNQEHAAYRLLTKSKSEANLFLSDYAQSLTSRKQKIDTEGNEGLENAPPCKVRRISP